MAKSKVIETAAGPMYGPLAARYTFHLVQTAKSGGCGKATLIGHSDNLDTIKRLQYRYRNWPAGSTMILDGEGKEVK